MEKYQAMEAIIKKRKNNFIKVHKEGHIQYIIYNRPEKSNAFTVDMFYNATNAIRSANQDGSIKFIVIYGEGRSFSTGNDLFNFADPDFDDFAPIVLFK
jgi:enoyl-CoA hydratase/carnithine racemase